MMYAVIIVSAASEIIPITIAISVINNVIKAIVFGNINISMIIVILINIIIIIISLSAIGHRNQYINTLFPQIV